MITRYTLPEMSAVWSLENKFATWLKLEIFACEKYTQLKMMPEKSLLNIKKRAAFSVDRILEIEKDVKHDVIAFLTNVNENIGDDSKYIHFGLTSSDVCDTALSYTIKQASQLILKKINRFLSVLKKQALAYKMTPVMGRTHGIHAEPTTLGLKFALWYSIMQRNKKQFQQAMTAIAVGKLSGPVGTYSNIPPEVEEYVCKKMGLKPALISTQILQRDRHAQYLNTVAVIAGSLELIATQIRLMQQTELSELEEFFGKKQKGSSAMPHKRNPVGSENICGLARVIKGYAAAGLNNIPLWHERDISHSGAERIIIPDAAILLDYMLNRLCGMVEQLTVYPRRMKKNIFASNSLFFSSRLLLELINTFGYTREYAYKIVQDIAMKCFKKDIDFRTELVRDKRIKLTRKEIDRICSIDRYVKHIDYIYQKMKLIK